MNSRLESEDDEEGLWYNTSLQTFILSKYVSTVVGFSIYVSVAVFSAMGGHNSFLNANKYNDTQILS